MPDITNCINCPIHKFYVRIYDRGIDYRDCPHNCPYDSSVQCKDCKHLMFSDCYGECSKAYLPGIVRPEDSCGRGERKEKK